MARRYKAVPVGYADPNTLLVAAADPANVLAVDDIQIATGLDCRIAVAAEEDVEALLARLGTLQSAAAEAIIEEQDLAEEGEGFDGQHPLAEVSEMQASAEDAPVIKLVYSILAQAVKERASDIHIEPEEDELRIRFRVDGVLDAAAQCPSGCQRHRLAREDHGELNIAEKRLPQDGRIGVKIAGRRHRHARRRPSRPSYGERIVIRLLDKERSQRSLDDSA